MVLWHVLETGIYKVEDIKECNVVLARPDVKLKISCLNLHQILPQLSMYSCLQVSKRVFVYRLNESQSQLKVSIYKVNAIETMFTIFRIPLIALFVI